jgi:hypothetical protein
MFIAEPQIPDNANLAIEMVHLCLMDLTQQHSTQNPSVYDGPAEWDHQVDGSSVNKNLTKFGYMGWLCGTDQVRSN